MSYNGGWLLNWIVVYLAWAEAEQKHDSSKSTAQFSLQTDIVYLEWATAGEMIVITPASLQCVIALRCAPMALLWYIIV